MCHVAAKHATRYEPFKRFGPFKSKRPVYTAAKIDSFQAALYWSMIREVFGRAAKS